MYSKYFKRVVDIVGSLIGLVVLLPLLLVVALWIQLDSRGGYIFKQQRYGKDKKPFTIYKFRTMYTGTPDDKATSEFHDSHAYITRVGKIMRKLSIDELPQLINVLIGNMSLIGPRPVVLSEKRLIKLRDKVGANTLKPGIAGWAQANGRDELDDIAKAEMDGWYADNLSFKTDVLCVLKTVWVIMSIAGHVEGHEQTDNNRRDDGAVAAGD